MRSDDYPAADFIAMRPEDGGFIQKIISEHGRQIIDRLNSAIGPAMDRAMQEGEDIASSLSRQVQNRKNQIENEISQPIEFRLLAENPSEKIVRRYGDRAINREIDQVLSIIRSRNAGESLLEISTQGTKSFNYTFDIHKSKSFHSIVSQREIGAAVIYAARVRQLDRDLLKGKIVNLENDKVVAIHFLNEEDFVKTHPYLANNKDMIFIGSPIIEYGAFDPNAGDIYFIDLAK